MSPLFAFLSLAGCSGNEAVATSAGPPRVEVVEVRASELADALPVSAVLEASRWQALYFQQSGIVGRVPVAEGAQVAQGELLASLNTASQRNSVAQAQLQQQSAELDLAQAEHDLEATRRMARAEAASPEELYDAEQKVLEARTQVEQATLQLQGQQIKLRQMSLVAPFDGVLAEVNLRVGDKIMGDASDPDSEHGSRPPMVLVDDSAFELRASVPEGDATGLRIGLPARVQSMNDRDNPLPGQVSWVAPAVDRDSRTVAFRVQLETSPRDHPPWLRDGASVLVELLTEQRSDALTVPDSALLYHRGESFVYVVEGGQARRTAVVQGLVTGDRVEIRSGLQPGQQVAVDQLHRLADGMPVQAVAGGEL